MTEEDRRTYDFANEGNDEQPCPTVYELLVDGWAAYYQWLDDLRRAITPGQKPRR